MLGTRPLPSSLSRTQELTRAPFSLHRRPTQLGSTFSISNRPWTSSMRRWGRTAPGFWAPFPARNHSPPALGTSRQAVFSEMHAGWSPKVWGEHLQGRPRWGVGSRISSAREMLTGADCTVWWPRVSLRSQKRLGTSDFCLRFPSYIGGY